MVVISGLTNLYSVRFKNKCVDFVNNADTFIWHDCRVRYQKMRKTVVIVTGKNICTVRIKNSSYCYWKKIFVQSVSKTVVIVTGKKYLYSPYQKQ